MTKADFTKEIARVLEIPLKQAKTVLDVILDSMVRALRKGERVELRGFGSFSTHMRAARRGMNPRTGDRLNIPMKRVPGFKPSGELRALINGALSGEGSDPHALEKPRVPLAGSGGLQNG